jgi:xylulokinase
VLGIDLGTSSVKAVVTDAAGNMVSATSAEYRVVAAQPGWAESAPEDWWAAVGSAVRESVARAGADPVAIGLSGQMHGLVMTEASGQALRPALLWADGRASPQLRAYRRLGSAALNRLANPLTPGMAGPLLLWVAEHEKTIYDRARWALQPKDWLRLQLSGETFAEPSDASATLLYDVPGDCWDAATMSRLGLRSDLLAPLLPSGAHLAGHLTPTAAAHLGLIAGTPIAAGAADTAAAMLGSGLVRQGELQLTIGTGAQLVTPRALADAAPGAGIHLYRTAFCAGWYAMAATVNAGLALNWARNILNASWDELYAAAERAPEPGAPLFLPHLVGERTPYLDPNMRGAWTGLGLGHERGALLYAALEGVAFAVRDAFDALPGSHDADHLRLAGGGSTGAAWRQMLADVLELPLHAVDVPAASGRGAALMGAAAVGLVTTADIQGPLAPSATPVAGPTTSASELFRDRREEFHRVTKALRRRGEEGRS